MTRDGGQFWYRVTRYRSLVRSGFYDDPQIYSDCLKRRGIDALLDRIEKRPVGDGDQYRDITAETLAWTLHEIVDLALVQKEFGCYGGRGDIELPLCTEVLQRFPIWEKWYDRYSIHSVVVECKNLSAPSTVRDVQQLLSYLVTGGRGRFGLIVARNGFTGPAMRQLSAIAKTDDYLILPLSNDDLSRLPQALAAGDSCAMTYLRRKQTLLVQAN